MTDERSQFESCALEAGFPIDYDQWDGYKGITECAYRLWQAARAAPEQTEKKLVLLVKQYAGPLSKSWHWTEALVHDPDWIRSRDPKAEMAWATLEEIK